MIQCVTFPQGSIIFNRGSLRLRRVHSAAVPPAPHSQLDRTRHTDQPDLSVFDARATVRSMSDSVCASEMNPASNCDGATYTPPESIP